MELYKKYRPRTLKELFGQDHIVQVLTDYLETNSLPHTILLAGGPGTGKTSVAHILKDALECNEMDFVTINCASIESPIDTIRSIDQQKNIAPWGKNKVWFCEELQSLTRATHAMQSMLQMLEFTPPRVYFFLATSNPEKLNKALKTRCLELKFLPLSDEKMWELLSFVATQEKIKIHEEVIDRVIERAEGSARQALVLLDMIVGIEDEDEQLAKITKGAPEGDINKLARWLISENPSWTEIRKMLVKLSEDPEEARRRIYGYMGAVLRKSSGKQAELAYTGMLAFQDMWLDCGQARLTQACYEAAMRK